MVRPDSKYEQPAGAGAACATGAVTTRPPSVIALEMVIVLMRCVSFMPSLSARDHLLGMSTHAHSSHSNAVAISSARSKMSAKNSLNRWSSSMDPGEKLPAIQSSSAAIDPTEK